MIQIVIDGKYRIVEQGQTVLEAAKNMWFRDPIFMWFEQNSG